MQICDQCKNFWYHFFGDKIKTAKIMTKILFFGIKHQRQTNISIFETFSITPIFPNVKSGLNNFQLQISELKESFTGPQYEDQNDFEKEYKLSLQLWEEFPTTKYKSRGIITCLCLNIDTDPEEWREDLAKEVPVARRETDIDAWVRYF